MKKYYIATFIGLSLFGIAPLVHADTNSVSATPSSTTWGSISVSFNSADNNQNTLYFFDPTGASMLSTNASGLQELTNSLSPQSVDYWVSSTPSNYGIYTIVNTGVGDNIDTYCGLGTTLSACKASLASVYGCPTSGSSGTNCAWTSFQYASSSSPTVSSSTEPLPGYQTQIFETIISDIEAGSIIGFVVGVAIVVLRRKN